MNNENIRQQYSTSDNLNTRISIHKKYSVNQQGFGNWIFSNYQIFEGMSVLELGCGSSSSGSSQQSPGGMTPPSSSGFPSGGFDPGSMPEGGSFDPENMPEGSGFPFGGRNMPDMSGFGSGTMSGASKLMTLIVYGLCLLFMVALLITMNLIRRRR